MSFDLQSGLEKVKRILSRGEQSPEAPSISLEAYQSKYDAYFKEGSCWMSANNGIKGNNGRIKISLDPPSFIYTGFDEGVPERVHLCADKSALWQILYDGKYEPIDISILKKPEASPATVVNEGAPGQLDSDNEIVDIIVEATKKRAEIEAFLAQARKLAIADGSEALRKLLDDIQAETMSASEEIDRLFITPAPDNAEKFTALLAELGQRRDGAKRALHALTKLSSGSVTVTGNKDELAESGGVSAREGADSVEEKAPRKKGRKNDASGNGSDDGVPPVAVGNSINDASLRALEEAKKRISPTPIVEAVPPVAPGTREAVEGEDFKAMLADDRTAILALIQGISTPEDFAKFRSSMMILPSDEEGGQERRYFLNVNNITEALGRRITEDEFQAVRVLEEGLEANVRAKFRFLLEGLQRDLQAYCLGEEAKINEATDEAALDAFVVSWKHTPNPAQRWKDCAAGMMEKEQLAVEKENTALLEQLVQDVAARREKIKENLARYKEWDALLAREDGPRMVEIYRGAVKRAWQSFFDALRKEGIDMTWSAKLEEWRSNYLPIVREKIVASMRHQSGITQEQGEMIFDILLEVLDDEQSAKRARRAQSL